MARDIEEFLRKAAERRNRQPQGGAPPPPAQTPPANQPRRTPVTPKPPIRQDDDIVEPEVVIGRESVVDHVRRHINTQEITDHTRKLGEEVGQADEKLEARLHDKFDHEVGSLTHGVDPYGHQATLVPKSEILKLLKNPQSVRQAVILAEILKRPQW
jgi:hypothetical protein